MELRGRVEKQNGQSQNSELVIGRVVKDISEHRAKKQRWEVKEKLEDGDAKSRLGSVHLIKHVTEDFLEKTEES